MAWIVPDWPAPARVRAASTQRGGGVSRGAYASLNLSATVGDDPRSVARNRRRLAAMLGLPAEPLWLDQVHGTVVIDADRIDSLAAPMPEGGGPPVAEALDRAGPPASQTPARGGLPLASGLEGGLPVAEAPARGDLSASQTPEGAGPPAASAPVADGAVTSRRARPCAVLTADCLPVLLCDTAATRVAAVHAGWRGLADGVLAAAVRRMGVPPGKVLAWIGPGIGPAAYAVGSEVVERFVCSDAPAGRCFTATADGRWQADLARLARRRLRTAGVDAVYGGGWCTRTEPARFFSHRREAPCGRMATVIWLE